MEMWRGIRESQTRNGGGKSEFPGRKAPIPVRLLFREAAEKETLGDDQNAFPLANGKR